jgi:uncharacterized membrane protein YfcA
MAEVFTTFVSGVSHWRLNNVDRDLIVRLLVPGVIGGVIGAYVLTSVSGEVIRPFVSAYLLVMGAVIFVKAIRYNKKPRGIPSHVAPIGLIGGFCDAIGGGGWGPVVTTTLVARGTSPRKAIGSVNLSEFFVAFAQSVTFVLTIGLTHWQIVLGLLGGGVIAAPLAALVVKRVPIRRLMAFVGLLIIALSIRNLSLTIA